MIEKLLKYWISEAIRYSAHYTLSRVQDCNAILSMVTAQALMAVEPNSLKRKQNATVTVDSID